MSVNANMKINKSTEKNGYTKTLPKIPKNMKKNNNFLDCFI